MFGWLFVLFVCFVCLSCFSCFAFDFFTCPKMKISFPLLISMIFFFEEKNKLIKVNHPPFFSKLQPIFTKIGIVSFTHPFFLNPKLNQMFISSV